MPENEDVNVDDQLAAISANCDLPRNALRYSGGLVHVIADKKQPFEVIKCAFDELEARGFATARGVISEGS